MPNWVLKISRVIEMIETPMVVVSSITGQNIDRPKRRQSETSTNQKHWQPETSTNQNIDRPKRRQTKML